MIDSTSIYIENVYYFYCDVSDATQVSRVASQIVEKVNLISPSYPYYHTILTSVLLITFQIGHPTILINIAGIVAGKTILDLSERDIRRGVDVNLLAHFWTVKAFLPEMVRRDHGHVVTMASALAFAGCPQAGELNLLELRTKR